MTNTKHYEELITKESRHWADVRLDSENPQIWHDPELFEIFFGEGYRHFLDCAFSHGPRILELGCGERNLITRFLRSFDNLIVRLHLAKSATT